MTKQEFYKEKLEVKFRLPIKKTPKKYDRPSKKEKERSEKKSI